MTRHYGEPVEVRHRDHVSDGSGPLGGATPGMFLWRGRLYQVKEVLGHWWERCPWWATPVGDHQPYVPVEREFWRVEAGPGRHAHSGIFELSRDVPETDERSAPDRPTGPREPAVAGTDGGWRLHKIAD